MDAPSADRDRARLAAALSALDGEAVLIGFSGGLDSTVLLHALAARRDRLAGLRAIHVDHGLHADSGRWAAHCARACGALGVPLAVARVAVAPRGDGPEAAARRARHAAFVDALAPGEALVLAQHRDDQAETVLLRLLRGAGSDGLAAMRPAGALGGARLLRPLLDVSRAQLEVIARADRLRWIEDPSNASPAFDRNHVRHAILPALQARWPQAGAALATSARLLAEDAALLAAEAARRLDAVRRHDGGLSAPALRALDARWRARVLRAWLAEAGQAPPPAAAHARIAAELLDARHDAIPALRWPGGGLRRWRDALYLAHAGDELPAAPEDWQLDWDGLDWLRLPDGSRLGFEPAAPERSDPRDAARAPVAPGPLQVRARRGGERLRLPGRAHRHQLKHLLQSAGLPPWERARLPLLFAADGELLAAGDALVGARLADWCASAGRRLRWDARTD